MSLGRLTWRTRLGSLCSPRLVRQAGPSGIKIFNPGIFWTGFCQIPGSRDFSGRDFPIFLIPGFQGNLSGFFGIFIFASFACQIGSFSSIFIITFVIIITLLLITIKSMSEIIQLPCQFQFQCVERTSLLNVAFYVLSQSAVKNHAFTTPITIKMCL